MNRIEAIKIILEALSGNELLVSANGLISRDLYAVRDSPGNFYMLGSMGLASSIGLGLSLCCSRSKVVVLDGDGNILMNLGSLTTIGNRAPANFVHFVLDNESYESTGGQPTVSSSASIDQIAKVAGYKMAEKVSTKMALFEATKKSLELPGPSMILVKIRCDGRLSPRVPFSPEYIRQRFQEFVARSMNRRRQV